jgi:tetratricopeptide (TPR) repeat protein
MLKQKNDPSLAKIIIVLCALLCAGYGIYRGARWFRDGFIGGSVAAQAPADIAKARELLADGKSQEARALLQPIIARVTDETILPGALLVMAELELKNDAPEQALALFERIVKEFPNSSERPESEAAYARLLEQTGRTDEALAVYRDIQDNAPPELRAPALVGLGRQAEKDGDVDKALELYRQVVKSGEWGSDIWYEAARNLGKLNVARIFSPEEMPDSEAYTVQKGDSLIEIGKKLNTTQGLLMTANGLTQDSILRPNQRLKYTPKDFRIVLERSTCRLYLFDSGGLFKVYSAGMGMPGHETTPGRYKIGDKQKDPAWYKPGGGRIEPGAPDNELGTRWMPLVPVEEGLPTDLGIHGALDPKTVGLYSSHGCARMVMDEVEELYDLVVRSTPVEIVKEIGPGLRG